MTRHTLIFDLGTTYFKAALISSQEEFTAAAQVPTPIDRPRAGWSQMQPQTFLASIGQLLADLQRQAPQAYEQIHCISFATQANSFLLLDEMFEPVSEIILWNDQRAQSIALPWTNNYQLTGIPAMDGCFAPAKLLWLQQQQPDVWQRARHFCFLSDYLTHHFTQKHITEAGVAGLSGLMDIHQLCWLWEPMNKLHLQTLRWPTIARAGTSLGTIDATIAEKYSLNPKCELVLGCLDQYAGALAADLLNHDGICETTGTVLASVRAASHFDPSLKNYGIFQGPSPRAGCYFHLLFGDISANLLAVYRKQYAPNLSYENLDALASALPVTDQSVTLVDFDLHQPRFDFQGDPKHTQSMAHQVQAIYYKVAKELEKQVKIHYPTSRPCNVLSLGGGANSAHWLKIKAHLLGTNVIAIPSEKPTCLGAYRLTKHA